MHRGGKQQRGRMCRNNGPHWNDSGGCLDACIFNDELDYERKIISLSFFLYF